MTSIDSLRSQLGTRYDIQRELGRGGMGAVYLARDIKLDRPVALKVLPGEFDGMRDRFLRETRTAASFSHPNIVPVYAIEEHEGLLAYAMAYVEGESLADRVKRSGPLGVRDTVRLLSDTAYALAYAHGRGVVHRDIKPDNIMIERATGRAMVMDFGIARVITAPAPGATAGLTRVGEVVGTPEYMSPEQATGDQVDGRSDIYALGLTAHFALTGHPAISGDTTGKVLARQITEELTPMLVVRPDIPESLAAAIDRCVAKDPNERFQTAEELVEALDQAKLAGPEIPLAIRLFAQELSSVSMVTVFGVMMVYFMFLALGSDGDDDLLLPIFILISVLITRFTQTMREVGRLATGGFSTTDIESGLRAVGAERDLRRMELRADPATRRARRRTVIMAWAQLAGAAAMTWGAFLHRFERPGGGHYVDVPGTVLIFSAMILYGVSLALLMRSPFSMPASERLFRLFWLGPIGSAFIRFSGRKAWKAGGSSRPSRPTGATRTPIQAATRSAPVAAPVGADARVASLEARVAELEKWRRTAK